MKFNYSKPQNMNSNFSCVKVEDSKKFRSSTGASIAEIMHRLTISEAVMHTETFGNDLAELVHFGAQNTKTSVGKRLPEKNDIIQTILTGYKQQCIAVPRWLVKVLEELQIEPQDENTNDQI